MARIAVFTDEPILAQGITSVLGSLHGFELTETYDTPVNLIGRLEEAKPEILLMDLTPDVTYALLAELRSSIPECRIVLWTRTISTELAFQAMELGIRGILSKVLALPLLVDCLESVRNGEVWFDKTLAASFQTAKTVALTKRESQLVTLLSQGLKNKEIAYALSISEGTVKVYLSRLFQKVGAKDRFDLALHGLRNLENIAVRQSAMGWAAQTPAKGPARETAPATGLRSLVFDRSAEKVSASATYYKSRLAG
jgi:two-component system nitrate/nitrite response regulator NarL